MVSDLAKASQNFQFLELLDAFFVAGARHLWFQILRKLRTICRHNLQFLVRDALFVGGAGRGQPYNHFSSQARYESTAGAVREQKLKVGNKTKKNNIQFFT